MRRPRRPVSHIGKVFFTLSGRNYVCSANSVSATNGSVVATAGHCVHGGKGKYASRWIFVPAYENGAAPYGQWAATSFSAPTQWTKGGDITYDTAFVKVAPLNGAHARAGRRGLGGRVQPGARPRVRGIRVPRGRAVRRADAEVVRRHRHAPTRTARRSRRASRAT